MFWSVVLPFKITFLTIFSVVILLVVFRIRAKKPLGKFIALSFVLSIVAFIPSCIGIQMLVDPFRFGNFEYKSYADIGDSHVKRYMPSAAKDIDVIQKKQSNVAVYTISRAELQQWILEYSKGKDSSSYHIPKQETEITLEHDHKYNMELFGWDMPRDSIKYNAPTYLNGAGFQVWHSESKNRAYQVSRYW